MLCQTRRAFVSLGGAAPLSSASRPVADSRYDAIAFDGFAILDPAPVFSLIKQLAPEKGIEFLNLWRTRQFEYTWLRSLTGRYADFQQITFESLVYAEKAAGVPLTAEDRKHVLDRYLALPTWPEAPAVMRALKDKGMRLALLSNMTPPTLTSCVRKSLLEHVFDAILSVDAVKIYKPAGRAYQIGMQELGLTKDRILFVASAGWDASGAKTFGYPTYWVNRQQQPQEQLDVTCDGAGSNLEDLRQWVERQS